MSALRILVVEDERNMAGLLFSELEMIRRTFPDSPITMAGSYKGMLLALMTNPAPDVVILDLTLPDSRMTETISSIGEIEKIATVVIVTGSHPEQVQPLLTNPDVEILHKDKSLFQGNSLILAIGRALSRFGKQLKGDDFSVRMERIDGFIVKLKEWEQKNAKST